MQTIFPITPLIRWLTGYRDQPFQLASPRIEQLSARKILKASFPVWGKITCTHGVLWITRDGEAEDIVLRFGECITTEPRSRFVIEALEEAVMEIVGSSGFAS